MIEINRINSPTLFMLLMRRIIQGPLIRLDRWQGYYKNKVHRSEPLFYIGLLIANSIIWLHIVMKFLMFSLNRSVDKSVFDLFMI